MVLAAACLASALCTLALPIETKDRGLTVRTLCPYRHLTGMVSLNQRQLLHRRDVHALQETLDNDQAAVHEPLLASQSGPSDL